VEGQLGGQQPQNTWKTQKKQRLFLRVATRINLIHACHTFDFPETGQNDRPETAERPQWRHANWANLRRYSCALRRFYEEALKVRLI